MQDPVARTVQYLSDYVPEVAGPFMTVPAGWEWNTLLVTVTDVGGDGDRSVVLDDARLMIEVFHPNSVTASEWARDLHGLIRAWRDPSLEGGVVFNRTVQRPTFIPDEATRTAGYFFLVDMIFRADRRELNKHN